MNIEDYDPYKALIGNKYKVRYYSQNHYIITRIGIIDTVRARTITVVNIRSGFRYHVAKNAIMGMERIMGSQDW